MAAIWFIFKLVSNAKYLFSNIRFREKGGTQFLDSLQLYLPIKISFKILTKF